MNNVANINDVSNSIKSMPVITHDGVPVVTTETIASLYDTAVSNIKTNFSRNAKRFIEGKHYFKLTGSILRELKRKVTQSNSVKIARNVNALILWTERGAARHAKMLDTDNAWDVFEALEDFYFAKKEDAQKKSNFRQSTAKELIPLRQTAERLIATGVGNIYPDIWKYVHKEFGIEHINELLPEQIPQAISFLDALEGEYLPKQDELPPSNQQITSDELSRLLVVRNRFDKAISIWKDNLCRNLIRMDVPSAVPFNQAVTDAISELRFITDKLSERLIA